MGMYVGIDVHRGFWQTAVMDEQGAMVERAKIRRVGYETNSRWDLGPNLRRILDLVSWF